MVIIKVVDSVLPEYQFIRIDKWNTPVRSPDIDKAMVFDDSTIAQEHIIKHQLGSTGHEHQIIKLSSTNSLNDSKIIAKTSFQNNGKGKFLVAIESIK